MTAFWHGAVLAVTCLGFIVYAVMIPLSARQFHRAGRDDVSISVRRRVRTYCVIVFVLSVAGFFGTGHVLWRMVS